MIHQVRQSWPIRDNMHTITYLAKNDDNNKVDAGCSDRGDS